MKIDIRITQQRVQRLFAKLSKAGGKPITPLKQIGLYFWREIMNTFRSEGHRDEHPKWKELSPYTLARRRKQGKGAKILQDTGTLRQSFSYKASNTQVSIGTNLWYAEKHQRGSDEKYYKIPKREMVFLTERDKYTIPRIVLNYLQSVVRGA